MDRTKKTKDIRVKICSWSSHRPHSDTASVKSSPIETSEVNGPGGYGSVAHLIAATGRSQVLAVGS